MEPELYGLTPPGVSLHFARLQAGPTTTPEAFIQGYLDSIPDAAAVLARVEPDVIVFGLTAGSFLPQSGGSEGIETSIMARTGVPGVATGTCVVEALRAMGIQRLVEVAPYTPALSELGRDYLAQHGFHVTALHVIPAMAGGVQNIYRLRPERVYREVKTAVQGQQIDGVFLSGTGVRSVEMIPLLEDDLGLPVISSNLAIMWYVLQRLGIRPRPNATRLLR
jgi:maleate cis-trans isomerase